MTAASDDQIVETLAVHSPEWRGEPEAHAVVWCCTCGDHWAREYSGFLAHLAEVIEPIIRAREAQVLTTITEAIGGLRDVLVSTSGDQGSYLVAAMLDKAIDIAVTAVEATP